MYKENFTRLTLEQSDNKITWEVPYEDVLGEDLMQAIMTLMVGITFSEDTVYTSMADYLRNHCDKYDIYEKIIDEGDIS